MLRRTMLALILTLAAGGVAHAQYGGGAGGGGGGRGGGHCGGRGGGGGRGGWSKPADGPPGPAKTVTPANQVQIIGVVKAIDAENERLTIAYEPVDALNWPAGTQPFPVAKTALLNVASVGQTVRFSLDSGHISAITPFTPPPQ